MSNESLTGKAFALHSKIFEGLECQTKILKICLTLARLILYNPNFKIVRF